MFRLTHSEWCPEATRRAPVDSGPRLDDQMEMVPSEEKQLVPKEVRDDRAIITPTNHTIALYKSHFEPEIRQRRDGKVRVTASVERLAAVLAAAQLTISQQVLPAD